MVGPDFDYRAEITSLQSEIESSGFRNVTYLRKGSSGIAFHVADTRSGEEALLKLTTGGGSSGLTLMNELDVVGARRHEAEGLNQVTGYPLGIAPEIFGLTPTMRGTAIRGPIPIRLGGKYGILLEWIQEAEVGRPGYHRLDKLIPEKFGSWTDLEILDIAAPFAYLLAQAHKKGIIYNDIGADKADHLYWDQPKHQLKVIDWANVMFMTDANFRGARMPYHDVRGLARLIYRMRTNADPTEIESTRQPNLLRDNLINTGHPELAILIAKCLADFPSHSSRIPSEEERPVSDGEGLYTAMEVAIRSLREKEARPKLVLNRPAERPARPGLHLRRPT